MKNKSLFAKNVFGALFLSLLLIFVFASCDEFLNLLNTKCCEDCEVDYCADCLAGVCADKCGTECCKEDVDLEGDSELITEIFIPNYGAISHVRLSIRGTGAVYTEFATLEITDGDINDLIDVPDGFPGVVWTGIYTDIKALTYAPGSLKIDLLDNNKTVILSGYNSSSVTTVDNQTARTIIYPVPVILSNSGSLTQGEIKFCKADKDSGIERILNLTVTGSWPDIILFNSDGTYNKYYSISSASDAEITLDFSEADSYYIGIYANKGNVSQYSITLNINLSSGEFIDDFTNGNFDGWEISRSNTGIPFAEIFNDGAERGNVIEFKAASTAAGLTSSISRNVTSTTPMALSFLIKTNLNGDYGNLILKINDEVINTYTGLRGTWKSETILISAGTNKIEFVLEKKTGQHNTGDITNSVRLDNISFVSDTTASVVLHPRGHLNTYVGAPEKEKIIFNAEALRKDGSVRKEATGFTFSGAGVNSSTGVFTPAAAGNVSITVSQDGKSTSRSVTVHPANYMRLPYTYPGTGITYNGYSGTEGSLTTTGGVTITYPSATTFSADGFFTIEGSVNNSAVFNYALVRVTKTDTSLITNYFVRENFKQRIWLRFGPGAYTITVRGLTSITISSDLGAEGDITGYGSSGGITFNVTNTRNDGISADGSTADRRFIYPSYVVQSDDFRITNLASDLTFGLTDSTDKIRALHDYITSNTSYDYNSTVNGNRKKQDALTVMGTRYFEDNQYDPKGHFFAVCEGYSNLFAALVRAAGFEIRYVSGNGHGWNNVYLDGWKLVDVTHDDPVRASGAIGDYGPYSFRYTYFMLDNLSRDNYPHSETSINNERSVDPLAPWQTNGWY